MQRTINTEMSVTGAPRTFKDLDIGDGQFRSEKKRPSNLLAQTLPNNGFRMRRVSLGPPMTSHRNQAVKQHSIDDSTDPVGEGLSPLTPVKKQRSLAMDSVMNEKIIRLAKTPQQGRTHMSPQKLRKAKKPSQIKDTMLIYADLGAK